MNFHAKSGVCSSKNERVMALGTKEDGHTAPTSYIQGIIQSKLLVCSSKVWTIFIRTDKQYKGFIDPWAFSYHFLH